MPRDLAQLRRQWQACLVQARAALRALAKAEAAYIAAHRAASGIGVNPCSSVVKKP